MWRGRQVRIVDELAPLGRREAGGRLVEQDEARRAGERERDLELALLAVAELGDELCRCTPSRCTAWMRFSAAGDERVVAARAQQREAAARDAAAGEVDVVEHRQPAEQGEIW